MKPRPVMLVSGNVRPVSGDWPVGGAARQAVKLSRALRVRGVDTHVVTHRPRLRFPRREVVDDVPVRYVDSLYWLLRSRGLRRLEAMSRIGALVAYLARHRQEYDVIHVHTGATVTALGGVLAGRWLNRPTIVKITNSGKLNDFHRLRHEMGLPAAKRLAGLLRSASRVVTLNEEAAHEMVAEGFHPTQIVHIPNGVEVDRIPSRSDYKCDACPSIVYVGRLHPYKGLDVLLESLAHLSQDHTWDLTLVGSGSAHDALAQQVNALGLKGRVTFTGEVSDVLPYLQRADVFVLPSRAEGISNAMLEAMAAGLPCVAADNAGNRRVVRHGETGLIFPLGDAEALASTLASLLADVRQRERLGRAARRFVDMHFSLARVAEAYMALYHELAGGVSEVTGCENLVTYPILQGALPPHKDISS
jgi:glycosyltransferase involved in cell wall biosynthesis